MINKPMPWFSPPSALGLILRQFSVFTVDHRPTRVWGVMETAYRRKQGTKRAWDYSEESQKDDRMPAITVLIRELANEPILDCVGQPGDGWF
jgi:hypothetical protein